MIPKGHSIVDPLATEERITGQLYFPEIWPLMPGIQTWCRRFASQSVA